MDLIQIADYAVIAILALSGFWILVGFLLGLWRGTAKSAMRAGSLVLSALEAFLLTSPIVAWVANSYGDDLLALAKNLIASTDPSTASLMEEAMATSPTLAELVIKLPVALVTPLIFLSFFWLLTCINFIIYKIIAAIVLKKGAKKTGTSRLIGGAIGAVAVSRGKLDLKPLATDLISRGLEMKDAVLAKADAVREDVEDMVAEARAVSEQRKAQPEESC